MREVSLKPDTRKVATAWHNIPRLLVRRPPFRIVFHHLPKCGGTSVHQAIRRCFPLDPHVEARIGAASSARTASITGRPLFEVREQLLLYHLTLPRMAYISGHVPFSERAYLQYRDQWDFITILRHPVARWLSGYFDYSQKSPGTHGSISLDLEEHLNSPKGSAWGSECIRFFGRSSDGQPTIQRALEALRRFAVVGVLEDLTGFLDAFQVRFKRRLRVPHFNRSPVPVHVQRQRVTRDVWCRVEEICRPDLELYDAVRSGALRE